MTNPGIVAAFDHAAKGLQYPRTLHDWLALAAHKRVPREVLELMIAAFDGVILAYAADGVLGVTSNGMLRCFMPSKGCFPGHGADMEVALARVDAWLSDSAARVPGAVDFEKLRQDAVVNGQRARA
jgi:hypothetical protein